MRSQCHSGEPFKSPVAAVQFASQTEIETVEIVGRLEPVCGGDSERRRVDAHLFGRDAQAVGGAQETVAEKAADAVDDTAGTDLPAIQQAGPEKMRGLVRRDRPAGETGRRESRSRW